MKSGHFIHTLLALLVMTVTVSAQELRIDGTVTCSGEPVRKANVTEVDANRRVLNQTFTDEMGNFTLKVSGGKTFVVVTADKMCRFKDQIGTKTHWDIQMEKKVKDEVMELLNGKGRKVESTSLINGHIQSHIEPQYTWLQQLNDTLFAFTVPVRVSDLSESYPDGRQMIVIDTNGRILCQAYNAVEIYAEEGLPGEADPYMMNRIATNNSASKATSFSDDGTDYFCYPMFILTLSQIQYLIDNAGSISHITVDTARGDNYWLFYPYDKFSTALQKMLRKVQKK